MQLNLNSLIVVNVIKEVSLNEKKTKNNLERIIKARKPSYDGVTKIVATFPPQYCEMVKMARCLALL